MAKFLTGILICLFASMNASAITFESGQHVVSLDIGHPCNVSKIETIQDIDLSGNDIIIYNNLVNTTVIVTTQPSDKKYTLVQQSVINVLILLGADKDTIIIANRKIDGCNGLVGSGLRLKNQQTIYHAIYTKSDNCVVNVVGWDPYGNDFQKALKTIKVTRK